MAAAAQQQQVDWARLRVGDLVDVQSGDTWYVGRVTAINDDSVTVHFERDDGAEEAIPKNSERLKRFGAAEKVTVGGPNVGQVMAARFHNGRSADDADVMFDIGLRFYNGSGVTRTTTRRCIGTALLPRRGTARLRTTSECATTTATVCSGTTTKP